MSDCSYYRRLRAYLHPHRNRFEAGYARARDQIRGRCAYGNPRSGSFNEPIAHGVMGNWMIGDLLSTGRPCMVARFGSVEYHSVRFYTRWRRFRVAPRYPRDQRQRMMVNAGFFPADDSAIDDFVRLMLSSLAKVDILAAWTHDLPSEYAIVNKYAKQARLGTLASLEAMHYTQPWTAQLAGRTVLVVHPFAETIMSQYATKRALLFPDSSTLPEFELKTLPAVQSIGGRAADCGFDTWFDALRYMSDRIAGTDFDVALIGAGAYGLPLAACVKDMGKQAVQMGGVTQVLFGIRGRRWEVGWYADSMGRLFNDHWCRPSAEETPGHASLVENGCYW